MRRLGPDDGINGAAVIYTDSGDSVANHAKSLRCSHVTGVTVPLLIRPATEADFSAVRAVHHDSIRRLCSADYGQSAIEAWTGMLTAARYQTMLAERTMLVAVSSGDIVGFALMTPADALVNALYVSPDAVGTGVGSALLASLEASAREAGLTSLRLESTLGAVSFYCRRGWVRGADSVSEFPSGLRLSSVAMSRDIGGGHA